MCKHRLGLLLLILSVGATCAAAQQLISPEDAADAVRAFESEPQLQFETAMLEQQNDGPSWSHRSWYDLTQSQYESTKRSWSVDAVSGEVTHAYYRSSFGFIEDCPLGPATQADCRAVAESFARARYSGFDAEGLAVFEDKWVHSGWRFEWRQLLSSGAWGLSGVEVEVNPVTASVQSYSSVRVPITVVQQPVLTSAEAAAAAQAAAGITTLDCVRNETLNANPDDVFWTLELSGKDAENHQLKYSAAVNAVTGEIVNLEAARTDQRKTDPAVASDTSEPAGPSFVQVRALAATLEGASVDWIAGRAVLRVGRAKYVIAPGERLVESPDGGILLSRAAVIARGRVSVPADFAQLLRDRAR